MMEGGKQEFSQGFYSDVTHLSQFIKYFDVIQEDVMLATKW